jgi:hypothetical protein
VFENLARSVDHRALVRPFPNMTRLALNYNTLAEVTKIEGETVDLSVQKDQIIICIYLPISGIKIKKKTFVFNYLQKFLNFSFILKFIIFWSSSTKQLPVHLFPDSIYTTPQFIPASFTA